jgi:hypothetical protein
MSALTIASADLKPPEDEGWMAVSEDPVIALTYYQIMPSV